MTVNIPHNQFKSKVFVKGTIQAATGLHIGGNSTEMGIGGADKIVVRDPLTNHPYIPGSSLRGKMRSLLERMRGEMAIEIEERQEPLRNLSEYAELVANGGGKKFKAAKPSSAPDALSTRLFGIAIDKPDIESVVPQRLLVRDAKLINAEALENAWNTDMPLTEVKTEVAIDRITSEAKLRQIERVPAGAEFAFEFILNLYGEDKEEDYVNWLFQCMQLLQDDYLGGHGSRGYGRIEFHVESLIQKTAENYQKCENGSKLDLKIPEALQFKPEDGNQAVS